MNKTNYLHQPIAKVQATEVTFELHSLGWKAFQNLCVSIISDIWGQHVESFFDSHDGGRDGAFHGLWKPNGGETFQGSYTVQCKFTSNPNKKLIPSDLNEEITKARNLASQGLADNYFLLTNAKLIGTNVEKIKFQFEEIPGINHFVAIGSERISQIILESPRLRMLVPRIYGLGDLSQILDQRAYAQSIEILSALGDDLAKFVITDAYRKSVSALAEHGFIFLLGEPASGKSTIAAALSMGAIDLWNCLTLRIRDADDLVLHSNPHESKQFFWVDDAFGTTQLDWSAISAWNKVFPYVHAAIRRGARIIFTSRDYIYKAARHHLKESAFPLIAESQVVIQVDKLSKEERDQILYNHIRLGDQPKEFKTKIKPFLPQVSIHPRFSPEIARRLGSPLFTKKLTLSKTDLDDFVSHPLEFLCDIIRTLDAESRSAIALVFMRAGTLTSPVEMTKDELQAVTLLGGSVGGVIDALDSLNGSLLILVFQNGCHVWRYKHPTIRDAFAKLVAENIELLDIYLMGTPIEKLFSEVTCGDVGIQGVKVIIPNNRFNNMMNRMAALKNKKGNSKDELHRFLAYRCSQEFLLQYIACNPQFIPSLRVFSYLTAVSDVEVIARLHEFGLLPEQKRVEVIEKIRELAVEIPDSGFLQERFRHLLTESEFISILDDVRTILLPNYENIIEDWRSNYSHDADPEAFFDELIISFREYRDEFLDLEEAQGQIDSALNKINKIVGDLLAEIPDEPDYEDERGFSSLDDNNNSRSIYDDVDQ